jgi:hypothetical protein
MRTILKLFLPEQLRAWGIYLAVSALTFVVCWKVLGWNLAEIYFISVILAYLVMLITCDGGMGRNISWLLNLPLPRRSLALARVALGLTSMLCFLSYSVGFGLILLVVHQGPQGMALSWKEGKLGKFVTAVLDSQDAGMAIELGSLAVILLGFFVMACTVTFNSRNMQELREKAAAHWRALSRARFIGHLVGYFAVLFVLYNFLLDAAWFWVALFAASLTAGGIWNLSKSLSFSKRESERAFGIMLAIVALQSLPLYFGSLYLSRKGTVDQRAYAISYLGGFGFGISQLELGKLLRSGLDDHQFDELAQVYRRRYLDDTRLNAAGDVPFSAVVEMAQGREQVDAALRNYQNLQPSDVALVLSRAESQHWDNWPANSIAALLEIPVEEAFVLEQIRSNNPTRNLFGLLKARYQLSGTVAKAIALQLTKFTETNFFRAQETLSLAKGQWISVAELIPLAQNSARLPSSLLTKEPNCESLHYRKATKDSELAPFLLCARAKVKGAEQIQTIEALSWAELPLSRKSEAFLQRLFP